MNRGTGGPHRGGRGGGGTPIGRGGSRSYSGSSAGSSGHDRPVLRTTHASRGLTAPSIELNQRPGRIDSPNSPVRSQQEFTMNSQKISETYRPPRNNATTPPRSRALPHTLIRTNHRSNTPGQQQALPRTVARNGLDNWAHEQELKIKTMGMPKMSSTKLVYQAMSRYGNVVKIDIQQNSHDCTAYVTFRPMPKQDFPKQISIGQAFVRWDVLRSEVSTLPSPVNPSKHYYEYNILYGNSIDFGTADSSMSMIAMHTAQGQGKVQITLNLDRKELDIQFPQKIGDDMRKFRFRLPIALLSHIYKDTKCAPQQTALIIPFESPPQFFIQRHEGERLMNGRTHTSFSTKEKRWIEWNTWFRETDVVDIGFKRSLQGMPLMNHKNKAVIDIGRWTHYRIFLDNVVFTRPQFSEFAAALADHGVEIKDCVDYHIKARLPSPLWTILQEEITGTHPHLESRSVGSGFDDLFAGQIHLTFPVRYQLEACLSNGYLKEHNVTTDFLEKLAALEAHRAIYILEKVVDKQQVYYNPMEIFKIRAKGSLKKKVPSYCILQRSAIVTPTMIHVASPIMETSNRITRKYAADADRFIRIKFSDEKTEGVLRNLPNDRAEAPFNRVHRAMRNGIVVAGRFYEFLAFGNSQFREHGAYFYAPTSSKAADDIRLSLGQFDHIKTVAKFGARLGQCFSTTRAMGVSVKVVKIPDIERKGYCFTDGVGKISQFLAQMAAQELGLSSAFENPPSLFQFRLGGCKGVLALDPGITGSEVHIRPSQLKFEAEFTGLEIIRSSALATPFFNRQIIIVLSDLGVPDNVFIGKQQEMVNDYEKAMTNEETAVMKLRKHIDMNETTLTMAGMVIDGFMKNREPFMMSLLKLWRSATIKNLKEKARIAIEDGAFVLGCVDETSTLKGHLDDPQSRQNATREEKLETLPEIFIQVDDTVLGKGKKGHYKIVEGICVLARNPSLHPGDLRMVRAVNVPALHHLKNVVVLPQTGDRDLANMCSGGDLDGDDYMVLWDLDLIPKLVNVPPMDFTPEKPLEKDEPITVSDISDFFVTYMQNDSLGQIAHAHLAQADFEEEGVSSHTCLELAKLHSQAVDYPKSGIPAQMTQDLRPSRWPHFMEKKHMHRRKIYHSKKILGQLYNQVQLVDFEPQWENQFDPRILDAFDPDQDLLEKAREIKESYDEDFKRLMAKHGIRTEFEAWSVFVLAHNQESRDYKFAEEFGRTIAALKAQYRETCREAAQTTSAADWEHLGPFVAAMYVVTAEEMATALEECRTTKKVADQDVSVRLMDPEHMPLMSFPWLFPSELGKLATGSTASLSQPRPAGSLQARGTFPHRKKHVERDGTFGTVETEEGVIQYGEVFKLDFGSHFSLAPTSGPREARNPENAVDNDLPSQPPLAHAEETEEPGRQLKGEGQR
ncbi:RNA dependent RNA polymerase-domain-containing protein [Ampelomyces quisqualis]|uniref:RNA-dependent RNA polymerase n=1 Tax=Ampelomyces quisqualis TaxID=50730 RepID=A0A6A5QFP5_AMPQU|nr:RNA dependent RNA polymerase-domain-containing protein [Ampelomyces quisqualis]